MSEQLQHEIHYCVTQAEALHMPSLDVELIKQQLFTRLMAPPSAYAGFEASTLKSTAQATNRDLALIAARRMSAEAATSASGRAQAEEECRQSVQCVVDRLGTHRRATLRAIAATRAYDAAWCALVPALRRFEVKLELHDVHSAEGRMTVGEHISRCVVAMRALAVWQAHAVNLVEAIVLWRSALNRPFPFALDGHGNILLRLALDAAAIRSSPVPPPLLVGGAGVSLDQVVFPTFLSHLPSLCEFALSTTSPAEAHQLFSFTLSSASGIGLVGGNANNSNNVNANNATGGGMSDSGSMMSTTNEDELVRSLTRRWERRALAMHFASSKDATAWAMEAAEDVVASFASLPGRRGPQQETYGKRVRAAEHTVGLEHNTHWQLMRELLTLCSEGRHIPLLHLPELVNPSGGEDGVIVECPDMLAQLLRTLLAATESLNALTQLPEGYDNNNSDQNAQIAGAGQEQQQMIQDNPQKSGPLPPRTQSATSNNSGRSHRSGSSGTSGRDAQQQQQQQQRKNDAILGSAYGQF